MASTAKIPRAGGRSQLGAKPYGTVRTLLAAAIMVWGALGFTASRAATASNANSPLGVNLAFVNYYSPEQPFLNIFKTTGVTKATPSDGWVTHSGSAWDTSEEAYIQFDPNGYPTSLTASSSIPHAQQFTSVGVLLLRSLSNSNAGTGLPYRPGQYVVLYDGQGTLTYGFDAQLVSASPGRDVINVAKPSSGGIDLRIVSTDPNHNGNYLKNIRVVKAEEEGLLASGNIFAPIFLSKMANFRVFRFTAWSNIGDPSVVGSWQNRTQTADAGWGSAHGVPWETELQLAKALGADPWLSIPHNADDNYITQLAGLAHATLSSDESVYVELSNEVWNGIYPQYGYAASHGQALWPGAGVSAFDYNRSWFGMRTAQMCDIWKSVWGADSPRIICTLGAQAANAYSATQSLNCPLWTGGAPCSAHNINAVAIAPYFGLFQAPTSWTVAGDGGLGNIFQQFNQGGLISGEPGGSLKQASNWEANFTAALAPYKLPLVGYEGGQSLVGAPQYQDGSSIVKLYVAANRDARMGAAYTTALNNWKGNGGHVYVLFNDIQQTGPNGEWGALESFMDTTSPLSSAPPKWQALQNFISNNACWWAGCTGASGGGSVPPAPAVPAPPTNLQVQ